jgi:hypothetical protein
MITAAIDAIELLDRLEAPPPREPIPPLPPGHPANPYSLCEGENATVRELHLRRQEAYKKAEDARIAALREAHRQRNRKRAAARYRARERFRRAPGASEGPTDLAALAAPEHARSDGVVPGPEAADFFAFHDDLEFLRDLERHEAKRRRRGIMKAIRDTARK